jgi:hypothetical protein
MRNFIFLDRMIVSRIALLITFMTLIMLSGCKGDDPGGSMDGRSGPPYKFKVELTAEEPDVFSIIFGICNYNYVDESGLPRTVWISSEDPEIFPAPYTKEFEVQRNFTKLLVSGALHNSDVHNDDLMASVIIGSIYVNNRHIHTFSYKFGWAAIIVYDSMKRKYIVTDGHGNVLELDKLD